MIRYTDRLELVPVSRKNINFYTNSYQVGKHILSYLVELDADPKIQGWGPWFVVKRSDQQVIGDIGFKGSPNSSGAVEIGYGLIPEARNNGYATEAVKNLIEWAFEKEEVRQIKAKCLNDNIPSIRVLEKLQMKRLKEEKEFIYWQIEKHNFY